MAFIYFLFFRSPSFKIFQFSFFLFFSFFFCNMKHLGVLGPPCTTHRCALPRVYRSCGSNFFVDCCVSLYNNSAIRPSSSTSLFSPTQNSLLKKYLRHPSSAIRFTVQCHHSLLCLKTSIHYVPTDAQHKDIARGVIGSSSFVKVSVSLKWSDWVSRCLFRRTLDYFPYLTFSARGVCVCVCVCVELNKKLANDGKIEFVVRLDLVFLFRHVGSKFRSWRYYTYACLYVLDSYVFLSPSNCTHIQFMAVARFFWFRLPLHIFPSVSLFRCALYTAAAVVIKKTLLKAAQRIPWRAIQHRTQEPAGSVRGRLCWNEGVMMRSLVGGWKSYS